jgi:hypothetical protein
MTGSAPVIGGRQEALAPDGDRQGILILPRSKRDSMAYRGGERASTSHPAPSHGAQCELTPVRR